MNRTTQGTGHDKAHGRHRHLGWLLLATIGGLVTLQGFALPTAAGGWADCSYSLYVANEGNGGGGSTVVRVDCLGAITTYATGFTGTSGLVVDPATGDLIISDDAPGIYRVDTAANVVWLAEEVDLDNPNGLGIDSQGRLLVADAGHRILRLALDPDGSAAAVEVLAEGFAVPQGVVETATGEVLFSDWWGGIYEIRTSTPIPVTPETISSPVGSVVIGNQGSVKLDEHGNVYAADFGGRIVRVSADLQIAKYVVDIPLVACQPDQAGSVAPGFRGLVFDPDGNLVATGYCLDNIYIFDRVALDLAWANDTPIGQLPAPFAQNPGGALDGPYLNGPFGIAFWHADADPLGVLVAIDIKPGSDPNCFNLDGRGVIPVAILGSQGFQVGQVDPDSLLFEGLGLRLRGHGAPLCSFEETNGDGYTDLVCHFEDEPANWLGGTDTATLRGRLWDGTEFKASDSICVVP